MISRGFDISVRLAAIVGGVGVAFGALDSVVRSVETTALVALVSPFADGTQFVRLPGAHVLITSSTSTAFVGTVSPSCSALGAVLAFAAVASLVLKGPVLRRAYGFALAAALCIVANLLRIGIALVIGARYGRSAMVTFHDWVGTGLALLALFGGFVLLLRAMLPSLDTLIEASATPATDLAPQGRN